MKNDGKQLESLVREVERKLLPCWFTVTPNRRVYNEDGTQIAEFDLEIAGKLGSTTIKWLIECRDRPSKGPEPASWIEQLCGRRSRFGFNKVTAVSTTGFVPAALEYANRPDVGIELREVRELTSESFNPWILLREVQFIERVYELESSSLALASSVTGAMKIAFYHSMRRLDRESAFLLIPATGEHVQLKKAFTIAAAQVPSLHKGLQAEDLPRAIKLVADYGPDGYVVSTAEGPASVASITFYGTVRLVSRNAPLEVVAEYREVAGAPICQIATFTPTNLGGEKLSLEIRRLEETGSFQIRLRKAKKDDESPII
jgi:hypothetical protein